MSITFAGQSLLMEDPGGRFAHWLDWAMDYENFDPFAQPVYRVEGRDDPRGEDGAVHRVGLPIPNYPDPPRPRLNSLYIPTGAGRWSRGLFLVDFKTLVEIDKIIQASTFGEAILKIDDGTTELEFTMLALDPRRVTEEGGEPIFILPLVDYRWLWQWTDVGNLEMSSSAGDAWFVLVEDLMDIVRIPIVVREEVRPLVFEYFHDVGPGTINASQDYLRPDPVELTRRFENYAMMLDAVAACVGVRVTFDPSTLKLELRGNTNARDRLEEQVAENSSREILRFTGEGQPSRNLVPEDVLVAYPKMVLDPIADGIFQTPTGELFTITATVDRGTTQAQFGTRQVFFDTCYALFAAGGAGSPLNLQELIDLTDVIARDFYAWLRNHYEIAYQGLVAWVPNGFDDYVLYEIGTRNPRKIEGIAEDDFTVMTKVRSLPLNFGLREQLHQTSAFFGFPSSSSESSLSASSQSESTQSFQSQSSASSLSRSASSSSSSSGSRSSSSSSPSPSSSSESSQSSESGSFSESSGDKVNRLVQDVCCEDEALGGGVTVCYTTIHWKWVGVHKIYGMTWVEEETCSCS